MGHKEHVKAHTRSSQKPQSTNARWSQRSIWLLSSSWRLAASSTIHYASHPKDTRNVVFYFNIVANLQWSPLWSDLKSTPTNTRQACSSCLHQRAKQRKPRSTEPGAGLPFKVSWSPFINTLNIQDTELSNLLIQEGLTSKPQTIVRPSGHKENGKIMLMVLRQRCTCITMTTKRRKQLHVGWRAGSQEPRNPETLRTFSGCNRLHPHPHLHPLWLLGAQSTPRRLTVHLKADTQETSSHIALLLNKSPTFWSRLQKTTLKIKICQPNLQAFLQLAIIHTNNYKTTSTPLQLADKLSISSICQGQSDGH